MQGFTIPAKSIDSITLSSGVTLEQGATINLRQVTTAVGDQAGVHLEGSLDHANWYTPGTAAIPAGGATGAGTVTALISGTGAALYVRSTVPGGGVAGSPVLTTLHTSG